MSDKKPINKDLIANEEILIGVSFNEEERDKIIPYLKVGFFLEKKFN